MLNLVNIAGIRLTWHLSVFWLEGFLALVAEMCYDTGWLLAVAPFSMINQLKMGLAVC